MCYTMGIYLNMVVCVKISLIQQIVALSVSRMATKMAMEMFDTVPVRFVC